MLQQKLELAQKLEQKMKLSLSLNFTDPLSDFLKDIDNLISDGYLKVERMKLTPDGPEFKYLAFYRDGRTSPSKKDKSDAGFGTLNMLLDKAGGGFCTRRESILVIDGDFFPDDFKLFVAAHEFMESLGTHEESSIVEFVLASKSKKLAVYLEWLRINHPVKYDNVGLLTDPVQEKIFEAEAELIKEKKIPRIKQLDAKEGRLSNEELRRYVVRDFLEMGSDNRDEWLERWPISLLQSMVATKNATDKAQKILGEFFEEADVKAKNASPSISISRAAEEAEGELRSLIEENRKVFSNVNLSDLERYWREKRIANINLFNRRREEIRRIYSEDFYIKWIGTSGGKAPFDIGCLSGSIRSLLVEIGALPGKEASLSPGQKQENDLMAAKKLSAGSESDKIEYMKMTAEFKRSKKAIDPEFDANILKWVSDSNESVLVRSEALNYLLKKSAKIISTALGQLNSADRTEIIKLWAQTSNPSVFSKISMAIVAVYIANDRELYGRITQGLTPSDMGAALKPNIKGNKTEFKALGLMIDAFSQESLIVPDDNRMEFMRNAASLIDGNSNVSAGSAREFIRTCFNDGKLMPISARATLAKMSINDLCSILGQLSNEKWKEIAVSVRTRTGIIRLLSDCLDLSVDKLKSDPALRMARNSILEWAVSEERRVDTHIMFLVELGPEQSEKFESLLSEGRLKKIRADDYYHKEVIKVKNKKEKASVVFNDPSISENAKNKLAYNLMTGDPLWGDTYSAFVAYAQNKDPFNREIARRVAQESAAKKEGLVFSGEIAGFHGDGREEMLLYNICTEYVEKAGIEPSYPDSPLQMYSLSKDVFPAYLADSEVPFSNKEIILNIAREYYERELPTAVSGMKRSELAKIARKWAQDKEIAERMTFGGIRSGTLVNDRERPGKKIFRPGIQTGEYYIDLIMADPEVIDFLPHDFFFASNYSGEIPVLDLVFSPERLSPESMDIFLGCLKASTRKTGALAGRYLMTYVSKVLKLVNEYAIGDSPESVKMREKMESVKAYVREYRSGQLEYEFRWCFKSKKSEAADILKTNTSFAQLLLDCIIIQLTDLNLQKTRYIARNIIPIIDEVVPGAVEKFNASIPENNRAKVLEYMEAERKKKKAKSQDGLEHMAVMGRQDVVSTNSELFLEFSDYVKKEGILVLGDADYPLLTTKDGRVLSGHTVIDEETGKIKIVLLSVAGKVHEAALLNELLKYEILRYIRNDSQFGPEVIAKLNRALNSGDKDVSALKDLLEPDAYKFIERLQEKYENSSKTYDAVRKMFGVIKRSAASFVEKNRDKLSETLLKLDVKKTIYEPVDTKEYTAKDIESMLKDMSKTGMKESFKDAGKWTVNKGFSLSHTIIFITVLEIAAKVKELSNMPEEEFNKLSAEEKMKYIIQAVDQVVFSMDIYTGLLGSTVTGKVFGKVLNPENLKTINMAGAVVTIPEEAMSARGLARFKLSLASQTLSLLTFAGWVVTSHLYASIVEDIPQAHDVRNLIGNRELTKEVGNSLLKNIRTGEIKDVFEHAIFQGFLTGDTAFFLGFTAAGGKAGATIGTALCPGVGTAIGAFIGGLAGAVASIIIPEEQKSFITDITTNIGKWWGSLKRSASRNELKRLVNLKEPTKKDIEDMDKVLSREINGRNDMIDALLGIYTRNLQLWIAKYGLGEEYATELALFDEDNSNFSPKRKYQQHNMKRNGVTVDHYFRERTPEEISLSIVKDIETNNKDIKYHMDKVIKASDHIKRLLSEDIEYYSDLPQKPIIAGELVDLEGTKAVMDVVLDVEAISAEINMAGSDFAPATTAAFAILQPLVQYGFNKDRLEKTIEPMLGKVPD